MTVTTQKKPLKSPTREMSGTPKNGPSEYDSDFYSSLGYLRHTNHASCLGYDFSRRRSSTKEERDQLSLAIRFKAVPAIAVDPPVEHHRLVLKRPSAMRNASSICSLPAYLPEDGCRSGARDGVEMSASTDRTDASAEVPERNFVTVNYQSSRTLLGRKRSFRGKKVLRSANSGSEEMSHHDERKEKRGSERSPGRRKSPKHANANDSTGCQVNPPGDLRVSKHSDNTATLFWSPPRRSTGEVTPASATTGQADILGYTVYVNDEVEAFVEGRHTCTLELVELQLGKVYRVYIQSRGSDRESPPSGKLQFILPNSRPFSLPGQAVNKSGTLSMSMPTLVDGQDDDYSEYSYDSHSTASPDDHHHRYHSDGSSPRYSDNIAWHSGDRRESQTSSGLGTSTPPSPLAETPGASPPTTAAELEPGDDWDKTKQHFRLLNIPGLGPMMQSRPASAEPHMHIHSSTTRKPRHFFRSVTTEPTTEPRPSSAPGVRRKVAFYCTAV